MGKNQSLNLPYPLILASTSSYRTELLLQLGWPFSNERPETDEDSFKNLGLSPEDLALKLSQEKARSIYKKFPHAVVIGSDQVCTMGEKIFSKPGSRDRAQEQLMLLQGREHELITSVTVCSPLKEISFTNKTKLKMRNLSKDSIESYLEQDKPFDCAGSYKLESYGIRLFEKIDMNDHTAIIGLPLIQLTSVLIDLGYPL